jgi:CheY-like chemotaxis protein
MANNTTIQLDEITILVVDDNIRNLKLLEGMLTGAGYRVRPALDGTTALKAAAASPPDLIFLDINMPDMDGFEVCRRLKSDPILHDIPVIFISAMGETSEKLAAFECGGVDYVTKPFQFKEVQARLETHLSLYDLRRQLELRVRERTLELEEANRKLQHEMVVRKQESAKKIELIQRLRQAEKMESLGNMAGGVAHDFSNLLTPIIGYAQLLQTRLPETDTGNLNSVNEIIKAGIRGQEMIKQILTFCRKGSLNARPTDSYLLIRDAVKQLEIALPSSVTISLLLDKECGIIQADVAQIHQVIMNLGINAAQAMGEAGGNLQINMDRITVENTEQTGYTGMPQGDYIRLEVRDNGSGIAKENLERIFEPFFSTKKQGKGTGLGLSMVHGIIKNHGGSVTVESVPDQGTCFTIFVPAGNEKSVKAAEKDTTTKPANRNHAEILIVEDDESIALMLAELLSNAGYSPVTAGSGQQALELFSQDVNHFDLVLTDVRIPDMDGIELSRQLAVVRSGLPVILLSGNSEMLDQQQLAEAGAWKLLVKPVSMQELLDTLKEALAQGKTTLQ